MRLSDAAKKEKILDATCRLLVRHGYQDIVLDDVAKEARVAKGTLFLYYKCKDDLLASAFAALVDQMGKSLEALSKSGKRGLHLLTETIKTILDHFERKHDFLSQFSAGKFPACGFKSQEMLMQKFRENSRPMAAILNICAQDGIIRSKDYSYEAFALVGMCRSAMLERIATKAKRPLEKETQKVLDLFLHGVGKS